MAKKEATEEDMQRVEKEEKKAGKKEEKRLTKIAESNPPKQDLDARITRLEARNELGL